MKAPVVLTNQQQRKGAYGKEVTAMHLKRSNKDESDQEEPRAYKVAIYLCKDSTEEMEPLDNVPSIEQQREICRRAATAMNAEIIGEFVDRQLVSPSRLGLHAVLELSDSKQLDFLIVASLDRLTCDVEEAFDIALRLYLGGTCAIPASFGYQFPWTAASKRRRS